MSNYNKLIKMLEMKDIEFNEGLTDKEIAYIEKEGWKKMRIKRI